jgi:hypothetical protein
MGNIERYEVKLLPDAPLSDDTELAFIDGRAFVNAAKHEEVVDRHVANCRGAVEALRVLTVAAEGVLNDAEGEPRKVLREACRAARRRLGGQ